MKTCSACGTAYSSELCPKCLAGFVQRPDDDEDPRTAAGCEALQFAHERGIIHRDVKGELPPDGAVRPPLDTIVAKMLEEDRGRRYATAAAVKTDLEVARDSL